MASWRSGVDWGRAMRGLTTRSGRCRVIPASETKAEPNSRRYRCCFAVLSLTVLAAGCGGDTSSPSTPEVVLELPAPLLASRIRAEDLSLVAIVNERIVSSTRNGDRWTIAQVIEPGTPISIDLTFSSGGVSLAAAARSVDPPTGPITVSFGPADYFIFDEDNDGFSNIFEIEGGSDPFDQTDIPPLNIFDTSEIAGLYNAGIVFSDPQLSSPLFDAVLVFVRSDGQFVAYDYQRDDIDQGGDCYVVSTPGSVRRTGEDEYAFDSSRFPVPSNGIARSVFAAPNDRDFPLPFSFPTDSDGLPVGSAGQTVFRRLEFIDDAQEIGSSTGIWFQVFADRGQEVDLSFLNSCF